MKIGKTFSQVVSIRLNEQEYNLVLKKFKRKKNDKLSVNMKNYIFTKLSEEPVIEYSIRQNRDNKMEVTTWENGQERDPLLYDTIELAMKYVRSIGAIKKL